MKPNDRYWNGVKRPASKAEFFNAITTPGATGDGNVATIRLYGPVDSWGGWWGISADDVSAVLDALPESVDRIVLRINSPGGEVFEALAILNMLRAHRAHVTAVVDGIAASAASFIAAGCDETVMSPGTQMMIHRASTITWGNADDLRKDAAVLESIDAGIIEVYTAKAGDNDWEQLLADTTWLTSAQAVELGLADRVAVIPDAGETITPGQEQPELVVLEDDPDDDAENIAARLAPLHERYAARAAQTPVSPEPGKPNRKENVVRYDDFKAGLRKRLGFTDAAASDETLLEAVAPVNQSAPPAPPAAPLVPAGAQLIDSQALSSLQADAADGREARAEQNRDRREGIVQAALNEGRIVPASSEMWLASLERDEEGTKALIATFPKNTINVTETGHSDDVISPEDALYARLYPNSEKGA